MRFVHHEQHSLEQIKNIESWLFTNESSVSEALFVATQLVTQGSDHADKCLRFLESKISHADALNYLRRLRALSDFIQSLECFEDVKHDEALVSRLYETDGYFFARGGRYPEKLLVLFTTVYNNFEISNVAIYALLKQFGVSVLILKDCTYFHYLKGVAGLGLDIYSLTQSISKLASANRISEIYISGFSSGGYASLYTSLLMPCSGYLGFSIATDMSAGSPLFSWIKNDARKQINQAHLINLRNLADARSDHVKTDIYFGEKSSVDKAHALNMSGVPKCKIISVENSEHHTIAALIERRKFADCIRNLLFQPG
jgi:hypothetical protein